MISYLLSTLSHFVLCPLFTTQIEMNKFKHYKKLFHRNKFNDCVNYAITDFKVICRSRDSTVSAHKLHNIVQSIEFYWLNFACKQQQQQILQRFCNVRSPSDENTKVSASTHRCIASDDETNRLVHK